VRRITLVNHDNRPRELELTSYAEVVLLPHAADLAHPAFGKLFLETEWLGGSSALLCRRRPRSESDRQLWAVHVLAAGGAAPAGVLLANRQGQTGLWRHGISGDLPILLVRVGMPDDLPLAEEALAAHTFWRGRGLLSDLVILNESPTSYFEELHRRLHDLAHA